MSFSTQNYPAMNTKLGHRSVVSVDEALLARTLMLPQLFSLLFLPLCLGGGFYTEEPPVKLLAVQSVATRFPAAASQYRDSVENGHVSFHNPTHCVV